MAILSDFKKVFEIAPVFRAENSQTNRHLTEYIGVDLEMELDKNYFEIMFFIEEIFKFVFKNIK